MRAWPNLYIPPFDGQQAPSLNLFDSFQKKVLAFPSQDPASIYVCGITPYDATHLGHAATYIAFDLIQRYLRLSQQRIDFIENITDIDDPLFERAQRDQQDWMELGRDQIDLFLADMTNLRVIPPTQLVKVTEAMDEIIEFVQELVSRGLTYELDSSLYLDTSQVTDFSDLPIALEEAILLFGERGGDPQRIGKRHPLDPLLWRPSGIDEPSWQTPFGSGRPGWHVECNAISARLRKGNTISMQGGGSDLVFPHHYMTMIQGKARYGREFAERYVHSGMIGFQGTKMSKSLGNLVFVSELIRSGVDPMVVRLSLMMGHYREDREWSLEILRDAERLHRDILDVLSRESIPDYGRVQNEILFHLSNDLDTPHVIESITRYVEKVRSSQETDSGNRKSPGSLARFFDSVLGLAF